MQRALCVSTAVICRGLYCEKGREKSQVSFFISLHKSPSLLKTDGDRMREHNKWEIFIVYVSRLFR